LGIIVANLAYVFIFLRQPVGCGEAGCLLSEISIAIGASLVGAGIGWSIIRKFQSWTGRGGGDQTFRLEPYLTLLLVATAAFTVSNLYLGPIARPGSLNCSLQGCIIAGVSSIVGILLGLSGILGIYRGLVREGYLQTARSLTPPQVGSGPEEPMILALAKERIHLERLRLAERRRRRFLENVYWSDNQAWYWCGFTTRRMKPAGIVLSSGLRGRLDEEEWKTLLSYYFIRPDFRLLARMIVIMVPFFLLALASVAGDLVYGPEWGSLLGRALGPSISLLTFIMLFHLSKGAFLREDRSKARSVGTEPLLSLFRKVDQLGLPSVEKGKKREGWIAFLWPMPNLTERIQNLQLTMIKPTSARSSSS